MERGIPKFGDTFCPENLWLLVWLYSGFLFFNEIMNKCAVTEGAMATLKEKRTLNENKTEKNRLKETVRNRHIG